MRAIPIVATTLTALALDPPEPAPMAHGALITAAGEGAPTVASIPSNNAALRYSELADFVSPIHSPTALRVQPTGQRAEHIAAITRTALSCGTSWLAASSKVHRLILR